MKNIVDELLKLYENGDYEGSEKKALEYVSLCKEDFMEKLTVDTATNFAGATLLVAQICAAQKKPWKAIPSLNQAKGCVRFMEDYMQDRQILASTCFSFANSFEYAGFLPEAKEFYEKALINSEEADFSEKAGFSLLFMNLRVDGKISDSVRDLIESKSEKGSAESLISEANKEFDMLLKTDPVEQTEEFYQIRYELEEKVDEILSADKNDEKPFVIRYWDCKKKVLFDCYGIEWKTPAECNPRIQFC